MNHYYNMIELIRKLGCDNLYGSIVIFTKKIRWNLLLHHFYPVPQWKYRNHPWHTRIDQKVFEHFISMYCSVLANSQNTAKNTSRDTLITFNHLFTLFPWLCTPVLVYFLLQIHFQNKFAAICSMHKTSENFSISLFLFLMSKFFKIFPKTFVQFKSTCDKT